MSFDRAIIVAGCLCGLLFVGRPAKGESVHLRATIEQDADTLWRANGVDLTKNGDGMWAHLSVTNISHSPVYGARFYAQFLDGSGRECFSLIFSQELTAGGLSGEPFRPDETRALLSDTGSIFPLVAPAAVRVHVLEEVSTEEPTQWLDGVISVPATIMGGIAGGEDTLPARNYKSPYLGLVSLVIDSRGSILESVAANAVSDELREELLAFTKSLRFNPAISRRSAVSSRLFILFVRRDSKAFSDDSSWPWNIPWVADAVRKVTGSEAAPVVVELAFERRSGDSDGDSGLEYLPLGSDWCPSLFSWTTDPGSGTPVRKWSPGWVLKTMRVLRKN